MTIDSLETALLICVFIAPGFIIDGIVNAFSPIGKRNSGVYFLYCSLYSIFHCAIYSWAYILVWEHDWPHPTVFILIMGGITIVGACILGIIVGLFKSREWLRKLANKCKFNVSSSIPTAWDYLFSIQSAVYVLITLTDGTEYYGYYGENSYTSSSSDERDIYIEKLYDFDDENGWIENKQSVGLLLNCTQIQSIEFFQKGDDTNEGRQ